MPWGLSLGTPWWDLSSTLPWVPMNEPSYTHTYPCYLPLFLFTLGLTLGLLLSVRSHMTQNYTDTPISRPNLYTIHTAFGI